MKELEEMKTMTRQEFVANLRRYKPFSTFSTGSLLDHNFFLFLCLSKYVVLYYVLQEKQWVFKGSFCVQRSDKVWQKTYFNNRVSIIYCNFAAFSIIIGNNR